MKSILFKTTFIPLLLISFYGNSQAHKNVGLAVGYTQHGISIIGEYNHFINRDTYIHLGLLNSFLKEQITPYKIPVQLLMFDIGYFKHLDILSMNKHFKTFIGVGGTIGMEMINHDKYELSNGVLILDKTKLIYGGFASAVAEVPIKNSHFSLSGQYTFYYHPTSEISKTKFFAGVGLKYQIK